MKNESTVAAAKVGTNIVEEVAVHGDHLGSTSYVTNTAGMPSQHVDYVPFGKTLLEEHLQTWQTPYKFNCKELDGESGLYYYGARYYDPRSSIFLGVDPLAEKYPTWSPYTYCLNNPIRLIDLNGMESTDLSGGKNKGSDPPSKKKGHYILRKNSY